MKKIYEMGGWCFDLPSLEHLEAFRELKRLTKDEGLMGLCHVEAERGISFLGKPLHHFESKVTSTLINNIVPPDLIKKLFPAPSFGEVFTQKEIDRMAFDPIRLDKTLSLFATEESPFLLVGGKYGDWLLGLGRVDLLKEVILWVRSKGFLPIFSGQWATFALPKAKPLDVVAYAVPINKNWGHFNLEQACQTIKRFEDPVISFNPLADGNLLKNAKEAFSFLFNDLKIRAAIANVSSEEEVSAIVEAAETFPSLIPHQKKGSRRQPRES